MWMLWLNKSEALFLLKATMRERERFGELAELRALLQLVHCGQFRRSWLSCLRLVLLRSEREV